MKTLINKVLALVIFTVTLALVPARAQDYRPQIEEKTLPVGDFSSISVADDFEVTLVKGPCGVKVSTDKQLVPYLQVYVRAKTLYITYDEKAVPKDIKKLFKGRGASNPGFKAVVSVRDLSGITLSNNAVLSATEEFTTTGFEMNLADKSQVKNLTVRADQITLNMKKNAQAVLGMTASKRMDINTDGNANLKLTSEAPELFLTAVGSSDVILSGSSKTATMNLSGSADVSATQKAWEVVLKTGGTSKLQLSGEAESMQVDGKRNSLVEANAFTVKKVQAQLSHSARVNLTVTELIEATSLVGGSALYFTGTPEVKIGKIIKSTLAPYGATAK